MHPGCRIIQAGTVPYTEAFSLQKSAVSAIQAGGDERFYLLEHPHVVTVGRNATAGALIAGNAAVSERGGDVIHTNRGGDVTYHGPGQIVGYPLLRLEPPRRDIRRYIDDMETMLIDSLATFGIRARHHEKHRGVWVENRKIASVGVRVSRWVTSHGFALNVNTDLSWFDLMHPCGIAGCTMTSMSVETGATVDTERVADAIIEKFETIFERRALRDGSTDFAGGTTHVQSGP